MGGQCHLDPVVDIEPLGVMLDALTVICHVGHERKRGLKIFKSERASKNSTAVGHHLPFWARREKTVEIDVRCFVHTFNYTIGAAINATIPGP